MTEAALLAAVRRIERLEGEVRYWQRQWRVAARRLDRMTRSKWCREPRCTNFVRSRGYCAKHYVKHHRRGDI